MKKVFYFIICALALAEGCNFNDLDVNNLEGPTITSNSAIPIGHVTYTMRELLDEVKDNNLELSEDSTSFISFTYRDTVAFTSTGTEIFDIGGVEVPIDSFRVDAYAAVGMDVQTPIVSETFEINYNPANSELVDTIEYSQGELSFAILTNNLDPGVTIDYTATVLDTRNKATNQPIVFTDEAPEGQSLENHQTVLVRRQENGVDVSGTNVFSFAFEYSLNIPANTEITMTYVYFQLSYSDDTDFSVIRGKFGQDTVQFQSDVLNTSFFEDFGDAGFRLGNPQINFDFETNLGLPIGLLFDGIFAVEGVSPNTDTTFLTGDITRTPPVPNFPIVAGETAEDNSISINNTNSSIVAFLASTPNQIGFDLSAVSNPFDETRSNFLVPNSFMNANIEVLLPLEIQLDDVTRDIDFSLGGGLGFSDADSLALRLVTTNEIPFSVLLDLEVYDENDSLTFVAAENLAIETPFLNLDGSLKQPRKHIQNIPVNKEGIIALNEGKRLNLRVTLNTPESQTSNDIFVKVLADYVLDIQISVAGTLNVDL
ncbi:MAG: hypothetical protein JXR03_19795 [Cyclobacteriaceae bacterium]